MAACGAMYLKIGVLVTALMLLVAGCTKMVDGRGVIAVPPPGSPIEWGPCQADPSDESRVPSGPSAECCRCPWTMPSPTATSRGLR